MTEAINAQAKMDTPLLETRDLALFGADSLSVGSLSVRGRSLSLIGSAAGLLPAFTDPSMIQRGSLSLRGQAPQVLLSSGLAAYVPSVLPLPPRTRVEDALRLSARLIGLSKSEVVKSLRRCHLHGHVRARLGELTRLQMRLLCLAHGLLSNPELLLLEDLLSDLEESEAAIIEDLLETELGERSFIAAVDPNSPPSRSLLARSSQVLVGTGSFVLPPEAPTAFKADGYWTICSHNAAALAELLVTRGARVSRSPSEKVLLVYGVTGLVIYESARKANVSIVELSPGQNAGFSQSHAMSGA